MTKPGRHGRVVPLPVARGGNSLTMAAGAVHREILLQAGMAEV